MSREVHIARTEQPLRADSTDVRYAWYTGWVPTIGMDKVKGVIQNKNLSGNYQSRMALQTASVREDDADAPTLLESSYLTSGGRCSGELDVTGSVASKMLVRFGVAYGLSSGTTLGQADTHLELSYNAFGRALARREFRLATPDTGNYVEPLTEMLPAIHVGRAKAVIVITGASANLRTRLTYRTATTVRESPNSWSTSWDVWHSSSGEFQTGELTTSAASDMYLQIGLMHNMSAGTNGVAHATVALAVRCN